MRRDAANALESQRDSATKPRVARNELPWVSFCQGDNPEGVVAATGNVGRNPFRVENAADALSQGSSFLATLGFVAESLWDSTRRTCALTRAFFSFLCLLLPFACAADSSSSQPKPQPEQLAAYGKLPLYFEAN